jgi:hypothetical protein
MSAFALTQDGKRVAEAQYSERPEVLRQIPIERQLEAFIVAMLLTEPPDLRLPDVVAERGTAILPYLAAKLESTKEDIDRVHLTEVLVCIERRGTYDVRGDQHLQEIFRKAFGKTNPGTFQRMMMENGRRIGWQIDPPASTSERSQ